ncbi:MAG: ABC transporter permease [Oscillospiraceae bacterium]|nr:ABC transporter permease [Oscillospiraceae bacterium]
MEGGLFAYIFSADFVNAFIRMGTPILFAALAANVGAKAGILCIGYEGMMLFAALGGVIGSALTQSLIVGTLAGIASGMFIAAVFSYFVLVLDTKPMLAGLAVNLLGSGGTVFVMFLLTGSRGTTNTLASLSFPTVNIPIIQDIPVLGAILSGYNLLTYLAFVAVIVVYLFLYKTPMGLRIRSVGESPHAAQSLGINVVRTKFKAMLISGVLCSFGGMFMSMGFLSIFTRDMVAGRGFIGIAAQNLGAGHPIRTMIWTMVFGGATAIGNVGQIFRLPSQLAHMLPYLTTIVGLCLMSITFKKKRKPKDRLPDVAAKAK